MANFEHKHYYSVMKFYDALLGFIIYPVIRSIIVDLIKYYVERNPLLKQPFTHYRLHDKSLQVCEIGLCKYL